MQRAAARRQRLAPGAVHLDHRRDRHLGVLGHPAEVRRDAASSLPSHSATSAAACQRRVDAHAGHLLVGLQEALLLVGEVLVEDRARGARHAHHVGDRRLGVALLADAPPHRAQQALALACADLVRVAACGAPPGSEFVADLDRVHGLSIGYARVLGGVRAGTCTPPQYTDVGGRDVQAAQAVLPCRLSCADCCCGSVVASATITEVFGTSVKCTTQPSGATAGQRWCPNSGAATVPVWDGTPIDVSVAFPVASGEDKNYPVVGIYHGWGGTKITPLERNRAALADQRLCRLLHHRPRLGLLLRRLLRRNSRRLPANSATST